MSILEICIAAAHTVLTMAKPAENEQLS